MLGQKNTMVGPSGRYKFSETTSDVTTLKRFLGNEIQELHIDSFKDGIQQNIR